MNRAIAILFVLFLAGCDLVVVNPTACTYDDECGKGHYCSMETYACYIVAYKFGGPNWCSSDSECGPGYECGADGYCYENGHVEYHPEPNFSDGCRDDSDCYYGEWCNVYDGYCYSHADWCQDNYDCPKGSYCDDYDGQCYYPYPSH